MSRKVSNAEKSKISAIIVYWINNGCWDTGIYAAACLGAVFGITITHSKFLAIDDMLRAARAVGYTYHDDLTDKIVNKINEMEE